jgi:hypothetical protein
MSNTVKPSRATCGSAQTKARGTPRACAARAAASMRGQKVAASAAASTKPEK